MAQIELVRCAAPVPYAEGLALQRARREAVARGDAPDTLYLLEHPPTITLGRKADAAHLLATPEALRADGFDVTETDRGGDVTYHGPGQLVAYPIVDLNRRRPSVGWYIRTLEQAVIDTLATWDLDGTRSEGYTGVWIGDAKVCAIGVAVNQWVTYHGLALNVDPDLTHFQRIVPCGIADRPVTSLARLLGAPPPMGEVAGRLGTHLLDALAAEG